MPEEIIRQLCVLSLLHDYKYPEDRIRLEWPIQMGREKKRADIVVLDESGNPFIIFEVKVKVDQHTMGQLKSYMTITGTRFGAIISATEMECIEMLSPREVSSIRDIPVFMDVMSSAPSATHVFDRLNVELDSHNQFTNPVQEPNSDVSAPIDEGEIQTEIESNDSQIPLEQLIGLEKFERINKTHVNITFKGTTLRLPIVEIDSYKILRKRFLREGVALKQDVKQSEWFILFSHLLDNTPIVEAIPVIEGKAESEIMDAIASHLPGFRGGWICSSALNELLRINRLDNALPRTKRRETLRSIGYDWHPGLRNGRTNNPLPGENSCAVLYCTKNHLLRGLTSAAAVVKAYLDAQNQVTPDHD